MRTTVYCERRAFLLRGAVGICLTPAGDGLNVWGHVTPHSLADVLDAEYFMGCVEARGGGLYKHDRIILTASAETDSPEHATLVVVAVHRTAGVKVEILKEATGAGKPRSDRT